MSKWNAEAYYKNSANQQRWARELIAKLDLQGNEKILDIGCGDGKITAEIATYLTTGSILGIDNSPEMINFAQSKFPQRQFSNLSFQLADARQLNFYNEFDIVISFACLHWVIDHIPVIEGIKNSLKPDGRILLMFVGRDDNNAFMNITKELTRSEKWSNYFQSFTLSLRLYTPDEYHEILNCVGLKATRVELVSTEATFEGKEGLQRFIQTTFVPLQDKLQGNLLEEFVAEIVDKYVDKYPLDSVGLIHVNRKKMEVEAIKV